MSTQQQVKAGETRLRESQTALLAYTERPATEPMDIAKHLALVGNLKGVTDEYVRVVFELDLNSPLPLTLHSVDINYRQ
jgi:hypothetical protein